MGCHRIEFKHDTSHRLSKAVNSDTDTGSRKRWDYRVKSSESQDKNPGMNTDFEKKDVVRARSLCFAIRKAKAEYLPESGELCWWTDSRRRLPVAEEN
ncbi:hypothetical protein Tco_1291767 [Tanacetum coccineum]